MHIYGHFDASKQVAVSRYLLPFNHKTLRGWICGTIFGMFQAAGFVLITCAILALFVTIVMHFHAFYRQFEAIVRGFNEAVMEKRRDNRKSKQILIEAMEFQLAIKE